MSTGATDLVAPEGQKTRATEENTHCHQDHPSELATLITVLLFVFGFVYHSPFYPSEYQLPTPAFSKAASDQFPDIIFENGYACGWLVITMCGFPGKLFWIIAPMLCMRFSLYL